ncbi:beta-1,6-galactanase [Stachybotrys elegans]|uniref:Beta-1,6-galactanase n=1 Tax=Stachybotrys elegans TaxID=80388 RepID=A0A8K0SZ95_9HYPO|nr:beta-1,6-galactanase [Stachybotrys elegans]
MLHFVAALAAATSMLGLAAAEPAKRQSAFPSLPFNVEGPNIVDSAGNTVKYAGTNWPGHGEVMIPEGLQYKSVENILADIKSVGMNVIRLTFAIELVDQIYANGGEDVDIGTAFVEALGQENGTAVLADVLTFNPQFTASTKRLEVYDYIVEAAAEQEIYINLDNHISSGEWCCSATDGNTWWGDTHFNADNWVRGLAYMAEHGRSWSNLASFSLRNEFREPSNNPAVRATYNWQTWYGHVKEAAIAVNEANPDVLVVLSGLNYDTTMQPVVRGTALTPGSETFSKDDFPGFQNKLMIELHNYQGTATDCNALWGGIYNGGAQAMNPNEASTANVFPVIITEFGFDMTNQNYQGVYATCLGERLPENTAGWMIWVVVGSYYTRQGIQDYDEAWGLYDHTWSAWRNPAYVNGLLSEMSERTLA